MDDVIDSMRLYSIIAFDYSTRGVCCPKFSFIMFCEFGKFDSIIDFNVDVSKKIIYK